MVGIWSIPCRDGADRNYLIIVQCRDNPCNRGSMPARVLIKHISFILRDEVFPYGNRKVGTEINAGVNDCNLYFPAGFFCFPCIYVSGLYHLLIP